MTPTDKNAEPVPHVGMRVAIFWQDDLVSRTTRDVNSTTTACACEISRMMTSLSGGLPKCSITCGMADWPVVDHRPSKLTSTKVPLLEPEDKARYSVVQTSESSLSIADQKRESLFFSILVLAVNSNVRMEPYFGRRGTLERSSKKVKTESTSYCTMTEMKRSWIWPKKPTKWWMTTKMT